MRTDYLYEFIKLTEIGNFQTAADALFISQSTLSKHILAIEDELGFDLISHNKTKYSLTAEGLEFLPYAVRMCDIRMEYTEHFKNRGKNKLLDIGTCHFTSIEDDMFSNAVLKFSTEFPDSLIHTPPVMATDNIDSLLVESDHGKFSCLIAKCISTDPIKTTSSLIKCETLREWTVSVLTRRDHPKAGKIFTLKDVTEEQLISLAYPTFANALAVKACRLEGLIPIFSNTLNSFKSICDLVSSNKGVFLATEPVNSSQLPADLCLTEVSPHLTAETFVAYNGNFNHEHEIRFLEILREEFR